MEALKKYNRSEFNSLASAKSFSDKSFKIHMIILGDNNKFWVMLPKYSEALIKLGYQYAN